MSGRLTVSGSATADGTGAATVLLGTVPAWQRWRVSNVSLSINPRTPSGTVRPRATFYTAATFTDDRRVSSSYTADADDGAFGGLELYAGETPAVVFSGAAAGAVCTVALRGVRDAWPDDTAGRLS